MYQYWGFGLNIASEIEFPELLETQFALPQLTITLGKLPLPVEPLAPGRNVFFHLLTDTQLIFEVRDVARYYAGNADTIIIDIDANNTAMRNVRLFVLATVIASTLLQRNLLPFHASAIRQNNTLFLVTGESGAGKSTTVAGLIEDGYTIFSDDVVVLRRDSISNNVLATASYPMIKLWHDTLANLEHEMFDDRSFAIRPGMDKYGIFFHDSFDKGSYPVQQIFILKKGDADSIQSRELVGGEAFMAVIEQIYRPALMQSTALKGMGFGIITAMLKSCKVFEITRPEYGNPKVLLQYLKGLLNT